MEVLVSIQCPAPWVDVSRLRSAAQGVLAAAGVATGELGIAVVDDETIERLNRRYLNHEGATDVLSFLWEEGPQRLEGEVIVSGETAARSSGRYGWSPADELLLYLIHGVLHLVGHDDATPKDRARMQSEERRHLARFGLTPRYDEQHEAAGEEEPAGESPS